MQSIEVIRFLGSKTWNIQRIMVDRYLNLESSFEGNGRFVSCKFDWIYEEWGVLFSNGQTYSASRRYIYEIQNNSLSIRFEDGKPFYLLNCDELPVASFEHFCGQDSYFGRLKIEPRSWSNIWEIIGPKKDLKILSAYF